MNSSTSSSRAAKRKRKRRSLRIYSGFLGFLVLFAAAEISIFRDLSWYGLSPGSSLGQFNEIRRSFQLADPENITTAIFGDSQSIDALRPEYMAEPAGMDPGEIFNFSVSGGKAYEIYHTYLTYKDDLPNLKTAFVAVNEHQINSFDMASDVKFRFYAGLGDRLKVMDRDNYGELLLGWVSKAFDLRSFWSGLWDSYREGKLKELPEPRPGGLPARTDGGGYYSSIEYAEDTADRWFKGYDPHGLQTEALESLLQDLHDRGTRIIILQVPRSPEFEAVFKRKNAEEQRIFLEIIQSLADKYEAEFAVMPNEGLRLDRDFRDVNHLNPKAAKEFSRIVAERWLKDG